MSASTSPQPPEPCIEDVLISIWPPIPEADARTFLAVLDQISHHFIINHDAPQEACTCSRH